VLYIFVPKGFFPVQDTGLIQGISEAAQTASFDEMSSRQQALAAVILKDPAVDSLSSFIGVDGTNTTLNSGRFLINLKPIEDRKTSASDIIRRLQPNVSKVGGVALYMQPVQDLTVEDRTSRTQYQYTLEDPDANELDQWTRRFVNRLKQLPELQDVATDQQNGGLAETLVIDRVTASRMGISPQMIDETLYDAFGQRQISTLYTQLNQYHVILETLPNFQTNPSNLNDIYVRSGDFTSAGTSTSPSTSGAGASSSLVTTGSGSTAPGPSGLSATAISTSLTLPVVSTSNGAAVPLSQVHYHFGSKQQLILDLLEAENARRLARQTQMYAEDRPFWQRYEQACDFLEDDLESGYVRVLQEMITAGWADPAITAQNTIRYYESVLKTMGPEQGNWVRLFLVPGMGHCGGGPGLNGFESTRAIEQWVEQGTAPTQLEGHGANGLTRPLCPYPQSAEYSGSGDVKDGRNWSCKGQAPRGKS